VRIDWSKTLMTAINAHLAADLIADGEQMPVYVWTIDHPAGRVLVDTGMIDSRPEVDDMSPTPHPENIPRDVACVINTHLHYDHCGGNRLFPGVPIHVQARELADARSLDNYTIRDCQRPGTRTGNWFGELDEPHTEGQLRVRALEPELVWLAHEHEPWRPRTT
jgi:N-acyl homoserine lactone hydrolase